MIEINIINFFLTVIINFVAALLQASVGFGYAILAMSLMPLVLPMRISSAVSGHVSLWIC